MKPRAELSIIEMLWGNWDRKLNTITIAFGFITTLAGFLAQTQTEPEQKGWYIVIRDVAILIVLVAIIVNLSGKYLRKESALIKMKLQFRQKKSTSQASISKQLEYANSIVQLSTQELFDQHQEIFLRTMEIPIDQGEYEVFKDICAFVTTAVRDSLKDFFQSLDIDIKEDISVSVKLILTPKDIIKLFPKYFSGNKERLQRDLHTQNFWVITAFRDSKTYFAKSRNGEREVLETLYSLDGNSAFSHIYRGHNDRFHNDDLANLKMHKTYANENLEWQKKYNSTLVVPIVLEHRSRDNRRYLGFLAVDSLNTSRQTLYEREECFWIMNHAAQVLANYFIAQILYYDIQSDKSK